MLGRAESAGRATEAAEDGFEESGVSTLGRQQDTVEASCRRQQCHRCHQSGLAQGGRLDWWLQRLR